MSNHKAGNRKTKSAAAQKQRKAAARRSAIQRQYTLPGLHPFRKPLTVAEILLFSLL